MRNNNGRSKGERSGDTIIPWIRTNAAWLLPGILVAGVAIATWFSTQFVISVINPQTMLEFREKSVKRECRAAVTECFAQPGDDFARLWQCLDSKVGK